MPHASGLALIALARAAFADASVLMFSLCVGIALLAALAAIVLLRGRTGAASPDQQPELVPHAAVKENVAWCRLKLQHSGIFDLTASYFMGKANNPVWDTSTS